MAICCNQLPIRPERCYYSVPNRRMRVFNTKFDFIEIEIIEQDGETAILAKNLNFIEPVTFTRDKHLKVLVGKSSVYISNETHRMSLSGITAAGELENLSKMHRILKDAGFIE